MLTIYTSKKDIQDYVSISGTLESYEVKEFCKFNCKNKLTFKLMETGPIPLFVSSGTDYSVKEKEERHS